MICPSFARPFFACALSSVAGRASRDSRGRVRTHAAARGGRLGLTDEVKSNGKATWHPGARLFSDASLPFFVGGRILESPRRSRDLNVHGRQSKPGFHFNGKMAIMRLWQSIPESQKNLNETHKLRKQTFQMHGSFRCPLLALSGLFERASRTSDIGGNADIPPQRFN